MRPSLLNGSSLDRRRSAKASHPDLLNTVRHPSSPLVTTTPSAKCERNFAGRVKRFFASSFWTNSPSSTAFSHFAPPYPTVPHTATRERDGAGAATPAVRKLPARDARRTSKEGAATGPRRRAANLSTGEPARPLAYRIHTGRCAFARIPRW